MESIEIIYYRHNNIDWVYYLNSTKSYPVHTHANHAVIGYVMDGAVSVICDGEKCLYHAGEFYTVLPDTPHAIETVNNAAYSMINACILAEKVSVEADNETCYQKLKQMLLEEPEKEFLIGDMAERIGISPYHMIRQFKRACGLTPHQFQIQCRVRKAQRLLEAGKSVVEAAYATGFCDQSHFDRCFCKIVRLTPSVYKQSVKQII